MTRKAVIVVASLFTVGPALANGGRQEEAATKPIPFISERAQLSSASSWEKFSVDLAVVPPTGGLAKFEKVEAHELIYPAKSGTFFLGMLFEPRSARTYVVRAGQTFYLPYKGDVLSCIVSVGTFGWIQSYFSMPQSKSDVSGAIAPFVAEVDDALLKQRDARSVRITLRTGVPFEFWLGGPTMNASMAMPPAVQALELAGSVLRLDVLSDTRRSAGSFWIDLDAAEVLRSVVDGVEVFRAR